MHATQQTKTPSTFQLYARDTTEHQTGVWHLPSTEGCLLTPLVACAYDEDIEVTSNIPENQRLHMLPTDSLVARRWTQEPHLGKNHAQPKVCRSKLAPAAH
jgi:hypothetical protein